MTQEDIEAQYKDCVNLLHKTVWEFISHTGLSPREHEELFSQANLYFMVATQSYNNKDTKFSTWVRIQVWGRLLKAYVENQREWERRHQPKMKERVRGLYPRPKLPIDLMDELSEDSKILITMLFEDEMDFNKLIHESKIGIQYVFRFLRDKGWSRVRIHRCFKDLKRLLV